MRPAALSAAGGRTLTLEGGRNEGRDFSKWNDVWRTLCGEYGARSSRDIAGDDNTQVMQIAGLSMAAHAQAVVDPAEAQKVLDLLALKYPKQSATPPPMPSPADVRIFRVTPTVISVPRM